MGHQKNSKGPNLDPVPENSIEPPLPFTSPASVQFKPHKCSSQSKLVCGRAFGFFVRLRDRYIKAMNEMAMGGDFTAVTGYHGWTEFNYTLQHCKSVKERHMEALEEESAAMTRSKISVQQL